jgi:hypothetical protein
MSEERSRLIAKFDKSAMEEVRIRLVEWKAEAYCDMRAWYRDEEGALHPTAKGIRLHGELMEELRRAIEATQRAVEGHWLLGTEPEEVTDGREEDPE